MTIDIKVMGSVALQEGVEGAVRPGPVFVLFFPFLWGLTPYVISMMADGGNKLGLHF